MIAIFTLCSPIIKGQWCSFSWVWKSGYFGRKKFLDSDWSFKVLSVYNKNDEIIGKKMKTKRRLPVKLSYGRTLELSYYVAVGVGSVRFFRCDSVHRTAILFFLCAIFGAPQKIAKSHVSAIFPTNYWRFALLYQSYCRNKKFSQKVRTKFVRQIKLMRSLS
jgi:hypothetical protein